MEQAPVLSAASAHRGASYHESRFTYDASRDVVWTEICRYLEPRHIPPTSRVLELGAGYCHFINNVRAAERHALDPFSDLAKYAASGVHSYKKSCTELTEFGDRSMDVVLASNLFEHISRADLQTTLQHVRRILTPNGKLIIIQPNFKYAYSEYFDDYTHVEIYTERGLADLLSASGFDVVEVQARFLPFSMKSRLPPIAALVRAYLRSPFRPLAKQMLIVARPSR